jgi:hypothetical protein
LIDRLGTQVNQVGLSEIIFLLGGGISAVLLGRFLRRHRARYVLVLGKDAHDSEEVDVFGDNGVLVFRTRRAAVKRACRIQQGLTVAQRYEFPISIAEVRHPPDRPTYVANRETLSVTYTMPISHPDDLELIADEFRNRRKQRLSYPFRFLRKLQRRSEDANDVD